MDDALLAKLTGRLGDKATVEKLCAAFGDVYRVFLLTSSRQTNLDVQVRLSRLSGGPTSMTWSPISATTSPSSTDRFATGRRISRFFL